MDAVLKNNFLWNLLSGLNVEQKMELITKLSSSVSESLKSTPKEKSTNPLAASFGMWEDSEDTYPTSELFADIDSMMTNAGTPVANNFDLLIGCSGVMNDMIVVTDNYKDFRNIQGIQLENWLEH